MCDILVCETRELEKKEKRKKVKKEKKKKVIGDKICEMRESIYQYIESESTLNRCIAASLHAVGLHRVYSITSGI